ncbi:MAG TPA: response regulator transcription factor [Chloroflexia bacterium]|nr:response regulator transcription factor [Chloroflexia bacterium]
MERILVIDDDPAVTSLLRRGLGYEGYKVEVADSGPDGLALARDYSPDLVILDVMMPGMSGHEVLKRLRSVDDKLPVIFLTAKDASSDEVLGLELGADDYITKPFTFEILLAHLRALMRRQSSSRSPHLRFADLALDPDEHAIYRSEREVSLTSLEFKLLVEFMEHPRQVLSKEHLLDRVWGYNFGGNANVVEVYVMQLRQKLEEAGEARLIHTVRGAGYILREE